MPKISQETVNEIKSQVDIVEVISPYINGGLRKEGKYLKGRSPFSEDKTPSFTITPSKNYFYDFSTQKRGNAIDFLMAIGEMNYHEILLHLAKICGIQVKYETGGPPEDIEKTNLFKANDFAREYFEKILWEGDNKNYYNYLIGKRKFTDEIIRKFRLGAALWGSWNGLIDYAFQNKVSLELLLKAKLVAETTRDDKVRRYDVFRNRIIFPIHELSGRVVGFGAVRCNDPDYFPASNEIKEGAKYINSAESLVYLKSSVLYGIDLAKSKIRSEQNCYLVEGYTDVISMHLAKLENTVGVSGTALTKDHARIIFKLTPKVTIVMDGDSAGIKAATRAVDILLQEGLVVYVVVLPDNMDPDEYRRNLGEEALRNFVLGQGRDFLSYKLDRWVSANNIEENPSEKTALIYSMLNSIKLMPDPVLRESYLELCSKKMQVSIATLMVSMTKVETNTGKIVPQEKTKVPEKKVELDKEGEICIELEIIKVLLQDENECAAVVEELNGVTFFDPTAAYLIKKIAANPANGILVHVATIPVDQRRIIDEIRKEDFEVKDLHPKSERIIIGKKALALANLKLRLLTRLINENNKVLRNKALEISPVDREAMMVNHMELKNAEKNVVQVIRNNLASIRPDTPAH